MTRPRSLMTKHLDNPPMQLPDEASMLERILADIPDGRITAIGYMRQLSFKDDRYRDLIREFDKDKKQDIGHLCRQFEIPPQDALADINREAYPILDEASKMAHGIARGIINKRLPKIVERGAIEAAKSDGVADRHFTLQKEGFHVAPKGTVISMTQVNAQAAGLNDFSDDVKEMASILGSSEPLELESGEETDFIEAELAEDLEEQPV